MFGWMNDIGDDTISLEFCDTSGVYKHILALNKLGTYKIGSKVLLVDVWCTSKKKNLCK